MKREVHNVLVLAPHMDDEIIGCGGSIIKHIHAGRTVAVLFFTDGSNLIIDKKLAETLKENRKKETEKVMSFLGATPYYLDIPDRTLSYNTNILKSVIGVLQKVQPDIIYVPHGKEGDREHRLVREVFTEAFWLASDIYQLTYKRPLKMAEYVLEYEVWKPMSNPNYYEDIEEVIEEKCKAIRMYKSQKLFFDYALAIMGLNQYRGAMSQMRYAEAFHVKKGLTNL